MASARPIPLILAGLLAVGCSDESILPAPGAPGGGGSSSSAGGSEPAPVPPGPPEPLVVDSWWVTSVNQGFDPVPAAIDEGAMSLPSDGFLGLAWQSNAPGPEGQLIDANTDAIYAVAEIAIPEGHHVFARGDTVRSFVVDNAARMPGDFYHSRSIRVPLETQGPSALVVVSALGRRNTPEVALWSTAGEVELNLLDATAPDLVVGEQEALPLGVPLLVLEDEPALGVFAEVVENEHFERTETSYPSLAPRSVSQMTFDLVPKAPWSQADQTVEVVLRISGASLEWEYERVLELTTRPASGARRVTRRSNVDGSTQYMGVLPPTDPSLAEPGLMLSLHGASVQAIGQAQAYSAKDWGYLVAPTNRRPFGFDWEEWGRLDALEALEFAMSRYGIDRSRVHLTGHSMGGHGSWHLGVHFGEHFGVIGPSAGWISFETYTGPPHPTGPIGRARAASETLDFVDNLAGDSVYIIHGSADDNVPVSHAQQMFTTLTPIVSELTYHEEPGARHWWDLDDTEPGADCVDWEPMVDAMEQTTVDPLPLSFSWTTPGPWVSDDHSFVRVLSADSPMENVAVTSAVNGSALDVTTTNVRGMQIQANALTDAGVTALTVDGEAVALDGSVITLGETSGKSPDQYGPLNQVFHRPFCFVWDPDGPAVYRRYAAWLLSWWSVIGNGAGCGVPLSHAMAARADHNLIYLGVAPGDLPDAPTLPIAWDGDTITVGATSYEGAVAFVYPDGDHLAGYFAATAGREYLLYRYQMFSSRSGMPDWLAWEDDGLVGTGFFDAEWQLAPAFSTGL